MKTPLEWSLLIAAQVDPAAARLDSTTPLVRAYRSEMLRGFLAGDLRAHDSYSLLPIDPSRDGAENDFSSRARLSMSEVNKWLAALGVPILLSEGHRERNIRRQTETKAQRSQRLTERKLALQEAGVRNFLQRLSAEEGVCVSRIKQDLGGAALNAGRAKSIKAHIFGNR